MRPQDTIAATNVSATRVLETRSKFVIIVKEMGWILKYLEENLSTKLKCSLDAKLVSCSVVRCFRLAIEDYLEHRG